MKGTLRLVLPVVFLSLCSGLAFAQTAPPPSISDVSPSSAVAGSPSITVAVSGANFVPSFSGQGSIVQFDGMNLATTFNSTTSLTATIPSDDLTVPKTSQITVTTPNGTSKPFIFTVFAGNPAPGITSLSPSSATAGGAGFTLTVNGSNFISQSTIYWNGSARTTVLVSSSTLTAPIAAADIATAGIALISVVTPSPGGGATSALSFSIIAGGAGKLEVLPAVLSLKTTASGLPAVQSLHIGNSGGGVVNWSAKASTVNGGNWLTLSATTGSASGPAPSVVQVKADPTGLGAGFFTGNLTVSDLNGGTLLTVQVNFNVYPGAPVLELSHKGLRFAAQTGGLSTPSQTFTVHNVGIGSLNWNALLGNYTGPTITGNTPTWLSVSPSSGSAAVGAPSTVTVSANPAGLGAGTYYGEIRVTSGAVNAPQSIIVVLTITGNAPPPQLSTAGLLFSAFTGGIAPSPLQVGVNAATSVTFTITGTTANGMNWLDFQPRTGTVTPGITQNVTVSVLIGLLVPAVYPATLTITFGDGSVQTVQVMLLVAPSGSPAPGDVGMQLAHGVADACSPQRLLAVTRVLGGGFSSPTGWPQTIEAQVIDDCGNAATGATVVASFSNGDPPLVLNGVGGGIYTGTWKPGSAANPATVTVRASQAPLGEAVLQVQGTSTVNPGVPLVAQGGVVNGASFAKNQAVAPGSIVSVFGVAMADKTPGGAVSLPLPTTLGGSTLVIGGINAPLYYSSDGQINAQIPYELQANTSMGLLIQLSLPGIAAFSLPEAVALDFARPGVFMANTQGQGVVIDTQGRVVDGNARAAAGDVVVVYATGLGATVPPAQTGRPAPTSPLAQVTPLPTVTVGGVNAGVQFAGLTPGLVGLYQVNVQIPSGVTPGPAVPLVITQNGVPSSTVTIGVR